MADILAAWVPDVTLSVPVTPAFAVKKYEQQPERVLSALQRIAALFGWAIGDRWSAGVSALTLYEPDRNRGGRDWLFQPGDYLAVRSLRQELESVRNVIRIHYSGGEPVTRTNNASVTAYGRRWMQLAEDKTSAIDTEAEAITLADAILSDLSDPDLDFAVDMRYFWAVDIDDRYRFRRNDVQFSGPQSAAVIGYRHSIGPNGDRTTLILRGKPSGNRKLWLSLAGGTITGEEEPGLVAVQDTAFYPNMDNTQTTFAIRGIELLADPEMYTLVYSWDGDSGGPDWIVFGDSADGTFNGRPAVVKIGDLYNLWFTYFAPMVAGRVVTVAARSGAGTTEEPYIYKGQMNFTLATDTRPRNFITQVETGWTPPASVPAAQRIEGRLYCEPEATE